MRGVTPAGFPTTDRAAVAYLAQLNAVQDQAAAAESQIQRLPQLSGALCGATADQVAPVQAAWNLLYRILKLLDDLEDGDFQPEQWPVTTGVDDAVAVGLNFSTALLARLGQALAQLPCHGVAADAAADIQAAFFETLEAMCIGQHDDLALRQPDLDTCWAIARAKSGLWFSLGCWAGARIGTSDPEQLAALRRYGLELGLLVQIKDDAGDLWGDDDGRSDLVQADRWTLPVAYAMSVLDEGGRAALLAALRGAANDPAAEAEARQMIIDSGAALFLAVKARAARHAALAALEPFSARGAAVAALSELVQSIDFSPR